MILVSVSLILANYFNTITCYYKQAVVVSLPFDEPYYAEEIWNIADFQNELAGKTAGNDDLFILVPKHAISKLGRYLNDPGFTNIRDHARCLLVDQPFDLWIRDYTTIIPDQQVKFRYRPRYLKAANASREEGLFMTMMNQMNVQLTKSVLKLDGGNVVSNGKDQAIISERVLEENKDLGWTRNDIVAELEHHLKRKVALIPDFGDTTGHADGQVSYIAEDVLLICKYGNDEFSTWYYNTAKAAIKKKFPKLKTVQVNCKTTAGGKWKGFDTARNVYVNILYTNNAVYVPSFSDQQNHEVRTKVQNNVHLGTKVLTVNTAKLSKMGGSVRCMTWQLRADNHVALALYRNSIPCSDYADDAATNLGQEEYE